MSFDFASFYLEKKYRLDGIKTKRSKDSSPLFQKTIDILHVDSVEGLNHEIEEPFKRFNTYYHEERSSFQERYQLYIETMEKELWG